MSKLFMWLSASFFAGAMLWFLAGVWLESDKCTMSGVVFIGFWFLTIILCIATDNNDNEYNDD